MLVVTGDDVDLLAVAVVGPELLGLTVLGGLDHAEGALDDVVAGAVILLQLDDLRAREILAEPADDAHVSPAPAIDALIVVADHAEVVGRLAGEGPHQAILHLIDVLELVDHHVAKARPHLLAGHALRILDDAEHVQEDVVEVDGVGGLEVALISLEALLDRLVEEALRLEVGRALALLLLLVDAREHLARREALLVELQLLQHPVHHRALVGVVVDHEAALEARGVVVTAEQAGADRVEGPHVEILGDAVPEQAFEAVLHLARGLVGEGDREDLVRRDAVHRDEVGDAVDDDPGFPASGPGEDQQRAVDVRRREPLGIVEIVRK